MRMVDKGMALIGSGKDKQKISLSFSSQKLSMDLLGA